MPAMKKLPVVAETAGQIDEGWRSDPLMCQGFVQNSALARVASGLLMLQVADDGLNGRL